MEAGPWRRGSGSEVNNGTRSHISPRLPERRPLLVNTPNTRAVLDRQRGRPLTGNEVSNSPSAYISNVDTSVDGGEEHVNIETENIKRDQMDRSDANISPTLAEVRPLLVSTPNTKAVYDSQGLKALSGDLVSTDEPTLAAKTNDTGLGWSTNREIPIRVLQVPSTRSKPFNL